MVFDLRVRQIGDPMIAPFQAHCKESVITVRIVLALVFFAAPATPALGRRGGKVVYPQLHGVRKVYVVDPHVFGYLAPAYIRRGLRKSKCLQLVDNPMKADAILMPVMYRSWLDKFGDGLVGACVSKGGTLICDGGDKMYSVRCDADGCISGTPPSDGNRSDKWVFIAPGTGGRISGWSMASFPSGKKVERAAGCPK